MYKVVFHVNELGKVGMALRNLTNLFVDLGEGNVEVELVAHSEAIAMLTAANNDNSGKIAELADKGVKFAACANSMNTYNLSQKDMLPQVLVVASAVGELVKKQHDGFGYIRP